MKFRGDTGLFRAALVEAGFLRTAETLIFNDDSKCHTRRRLKLWMGTAVFDAPQERQQQLEKGLRKRFGKRILSMYFVQQPYWVGAGYSLCIKLQD